MHRRQFAFVTFILFSISCYGQEAAQPSVQAQGTVNQIPSIENGASVSGFVHDLSGAAVIGSDVSLSTTNGSQQRTTKSGDSGSFTFTGLPPDSYFVTVNAAGFGTFTSDGLVVEPRQTYVLPEIVLKIAIASTEVTVRPASEVAAAQIKAEEKQRVLGLFPNFFTIYVPDAAPLTTKQKFSLTAHATFDPVTLIGVGIEAGIQQANNNFRGYGQGAAGYGRRFGAALGNTLSNDFLGHAVFPSLLHQDPRYFYLGSGSRKARLLHAMAFSVVTRTDSGRLTPSYSYLLADLSSGALSNLYYPAANRGAGLVFENAAIAIGGRAAGGIFREFFSKHLSTNVPSSAKP